MLDGDVEPAPKPEALAESRTVWHQRARVGPAVSERAGPPGRPRAAPSAPLAGIDGLLQTPGWGAVRRDHLAQPVTSTPTVSVRRRASGDGAASRPPADLPFDPPRSRTVAATPAGAMSPDGGIGSVVADRPAAEPVK